MATRESFRDRWTCKEKDMELAQRDWIMAESQDKDSKLGKALGIWVWQVVLLHNDKGICKEKGTCKGFNNLLGAAETSCTGVAGCYTHLTASSCTIGAFWCWNRWARNFQVIELARSMALHIGAFWCWNRWARNFQVIELASSMALQRLNVWINETNWNDPSRARIWDPRWKYSNALQFSFVRVTW